MFKGLSLASWFIAVGGVIGGGYATSNAWSLWLFIGCGVVFRFFSKWFADE